MNKLSIFVLGLLLLISFAAGAALHDRGNGLIYDDVLDITWAQDANPARTKGVGNYWPPFGEDKGDVLGYMGFSDARNWIKTLNETKYKGYSDWRFPKVSPLNGSTFEYGDVITGCDGLTCDIGYNIGAPGTEYPYSTASELAYMFHVNLGNESRELPDGSVNTVSCSQEFSYCLRNTGIFSNLSPDAYWTDQLASPPITSGFGVEYFAYSMDRGSQFYRSSEGDAALVWPVRDGDVTAHHMAAQPVPLFSQAALVLLILGCALLVIMFRKRA